MNKKLTRTDYLFVLMFVVMLIIAIFAFFYGEKVGKTVTENKYKAILDAKQQSSKNLTAYHQQFLVSYYHNIFLPYRDFQDEWFHDVDFMRTQNQTNNFSAELKQMQTIAKKQVESMAQIQMPESSPLLVQAEQNEIKSLNLFKTGLNKYISKAKSLKGTELVLLLDADQTMMQAKKTALLAQYQYYQSIEKWNESVDPLLKGMKLINNKQLSSQQWKTLDLNLKNTYVAQYLYDHTDFEPYYVQDLTIRIDEMIANGQAKEVQLKTIDQMADLLIQLQAVRNGDFIQNKNQWYQKEILPQIPFFFQ